MRILTILLIVLLLAGLAVAITATPAEATTYGTDSEWRTVGCPFNYKVKGVLKIYSPGWSQYYASWSLIGNLESGGAQVYSGLDRSLYFHYGPSYRLIQTNTAPSTYDDFWSLFGFAEWWVTGGRTDLSISLTSWCVWAPGVVGNPT